MHRVTGKTVWTETAGPANLCKLRARTPDIVSSGNFVEPVTPFEDQVARSAKFTASTQRVNCAIRVFSIMPNSADFIASFGVVGTLWILPLSFDLRYTKLPSTGLNSI